MYRTDPDVDDERQSLQQGRLDRTEGHRHTPTVRQLILFYIFKAVFQTLLSSLYAVLRPYISITRGRPGGQFFSDACLKHTCPFVCSLVKMCKGFCRNDLCIVETQQLPCPVVNIE